MKFRPSGMTYKGYAAMCKAQESDPMDEDAFNALPEESDDEGVDKGGVGEMDLLKALTDYDAAVTGLGTASPDGGRLSLLKSRMVAGTITADEETELGGLLAKGGTGGGGDTLLKSVTPTDDGSRALMDASPFLESLADNIDERLRDVAGRVARDGDRTREFVAAQGSLVKAMARRILDQDERLVKSARVIDALATRLGIVERSPAPARAAGVTDPRAVRTRDLQKSGVAADAPGAGERLTKAQVGAGIETLVKAAAERGDTQAIDRLQVAAARLESGGSVPPDVIAAVQRLHHPRA